MAFDKKAWNWYARKVIFLIKEKISPGIKESNGQRAKDFWLAELKLYLFLKLPNHLCYQDTCIFFPNSSFLS